MTLLRFSASLLVLAVASLAEAADQTLTLDLGDKVTLELILVPAGEYRQGSPPRDDGRGDDETLRPVKISRAFYIGKYPVTHAQFERFIKETNYKTEAERGQSGGFGWTGKGLEQRKEFTWRNPGFAQTGEHPVVLVTYDDAVAFTRWLSKKAQITVLLPTEAQWEYACRAGTTTRFPSGDKDDDGLAEAWCKANAGDGTRPVGQKKPNAWGLYDTCGNVHQWCRDWYAADYDPRFPVDPEQKNDRLLNTPRRVLRGGSWLRELKNCRSAARSRNTPGTRNPDNGFRIIAYFDKPDKDMGAEFADDFGDDPKAPPKNGPPTTQQYQSSDSGGGIAGGLCGLLSMCFCPIVVIVVIAVVVVAVVMLASKRSAPPRASFQPPRMRGGSGAGIEIGDDGFWLNGPEYPPQAVVRYRCLVYGAPREERIVIEPGARGTFVYTGGRPSQIEILEIIRQSSTQTFGQSYTDPNYLDPTLPRPFYRSPPPPPPHPPTDLPFSGYPSAY